MGNTDLKLRADVLADWLEKKAPEVWWFLDGEREVSLTQALPAPGTDLAAAFRKHGGVLAIIRDDQAKPEEVDDIERLGGLFESEDDERSLELAWMTGEAAGTPWLLVESVVNEDVKALPPEAWKG